MVLWILQQILNFRRVFREEFTPWQLALGCTMGMILGMTPKGNLIAVAVGFCVLALRLNLGAAMLSTVAFSLISPIFDPVTHRIGLALLASEQLRGVWESLYALPMGPWAGFHNTVVLGSFLCSLAAAYPFYHFLKRLFERLQRPAEVEVAGYITGPVSPNPAS